MKYALAIVALLFLAGCISSSESLGYKNIDSDTLAEMLKSKDFILVNVHIPYAGEIEGTDYNIPFNDAEQLSKLPKDAKIVLYCRSGAMSAEAAKTLVDMGYTNVYNLETGMIGWKASGRELIYKQG